MLQPKSIEFVDSNDQDRVVIEWMLSSVCNYSCSYCPSRLHDGRVRWPSAQLMMRFARNVIEHYEEKQLIFLFTGGEPTLCPHLLGVCDQLRSEGVEVALLSNGSREVDWWRDAAKRIDFLIVSLHLEMASLVHIVEVLSVVSEFVPLQVNLMMIPKLFDRCLDAAGEIESMIPSATLHYKPVQHDWRNVVQYSGEQLTKMRALNRTTVNTERWSTSGLLKGNLRVVGESGDERVFTPTELILAGQNQWLGWDCYIGLESLFVRWDEVYRGVCRVGGVLGSVYDSKIDFPKSIVHCDRETCNCIGGIKATKRRPLSFD